MAERIGILSGGPVGADGRHLLALPGDIPELVDPALTDEELLQRYELDEVVREPKLDLDFCRAVRLDGPLAGTTGYAVNRLGSQIRFALPPRPGGPTGTYELVALAEHDQPGELRLIELNGRPATP